MANASASGSASTGPLIQGTVLQNRYSIERLLGGGGMGMVYLARDQRLANRYCAIKEMVDHFIDPQQRLEANEYFAREADTLAQLKHQAVPAITDRFDDQNRHYLVMEYVEGRNLEEELASRGNQPLPDGLVIDIARQLCDVLAYLHGMNPSIVYRDMKPSNVMLTSKGRVVLIDFGIARLFKSQKKGTMIGTLGFAPPEQYKGEVDPRSDIYSLGATLHYLITARDPEKFPPFSFPPVRDLRPEVSENLAGALDAALAYEVEDRPASVQEFRDMMLYGHGLPAAGGIRVSSGGGTADLPPIEDADQYLPPPTPKSALRRAVALVVFSIVLAGLAFGATYVYSNPQLQTRLGIKGVIDSLPWKHQALVARAGAHPLKLQNLKLTLSTRDGTAISGPKASFTETELTNARYLKWQATFENAFAGLEARTDKVEARFFTPDGLQIASGDQRQFVAPSQKTVDFSGVVLMPDMADKPLGSYKIALYMGDKLLGAQQFTVNQDKAALAAEAAAKAKAEAAARAAAEKSKAEEKRLAMIDALRAKPLTLLGIDFVNSTGTGTALSRPKTEFDASRVLFVGWAISFRNRLYGLESSPARVDAYFIGPGGITLGSVSDQKDVRSNQRTVRFSGRIGNSAGGAFLPGKYKVNFYLNGKYFAQKQFQVLGDTNAYSAGGGSYGAPPSGAPSRSGGSIARGVPMIATGHISGLGGNPAMELRLRPQSHGFLDGELVIHRSGYGATPIEGFVRGNHIEFQVAYGAKTFVFEGTKHNNRISGTFKSTPSGMKGTWTAQTT